MSNFCFAGTTNTYDPVKKDWCVRYHFGKSVGANTMTHMLENEGRRNPKIFDVPEGHRTREKAATWLLKRKGAPFDADEREYLRGVAKGENKPTRVHGFQQEWKIARPA